VDHNIHDEPHRANEESDTWKEVGRSRAMASRSKRYTRKCQMGTDSAPQLSNRYNLLCNYSEDDNSPINALVSGIAKPRHAGKCKMNNKKRVMKKKQSKVMIFGDSHAKGCAAELSHLLKKDFEVLGFVTPGAGMKHMKDTSMGKTKQLSKEDVAVIWGGSNDIAKNNSSVGMKNLLELVVNSTHTNVILMSAPHRYNLMETSCVNYEIENFNRKLHNRLERLGKVEMIDVGMDRSLYTRHGQHLNPKGKEGMANKIASTIKNMLNKKVEPISVKWDMDNDTPGTPSATASEQGKGSDDENVKMKPTYSHQEDYDKKEMINVMPQLDTIRKTNRLKQPPSVTREDFLWPKITR